MLTGRLHAERRGVWLLAHTFPNVSTSSRFSCDIMASGAEEDHRMISVGETLRRERLRRNLDLDHISQDLKISPRFLEAIEEEQFDKLPARVFAKSFVRQYARLLELDEDEMAAEVQRALQPAPEPQTAVQPAPAASSVHLAPVVQWEDGIGTGRRFSWSSSLPALALVVVVMLVCSGIYSWWQRTRRTALTREESPSAQVQEAPRPAPVAAQVPAEPPAPVAESQPAAVPPAATSRPVPAVPKASPRQTEPNTGVASADRTENASPTPASPTPAAPAATSPAGAQVVRATSSPNPSVRVEVTADQPVWVLAQNDGKYLFSGTLEANQTRTVEADGTVTLRLGNAGGVTISLNGKPIGPVGPKGQVRTVQFTSGGFHIVSAPKPSAPLDIL